jgi:hypothetical protein
MKGLFEGQRIHDDKSGAAYRLDEASSIRAFQLYLEHIGPGTYYHGREPISVRSQWCS